MDSIPTVDAKRDRFGYWVRCPFCSHEGRPRVHVHGEAGLQEAHCAPEDLPSDLRELGPALTYYIREDD